MRYFFHLAGVVQEADNVGKNISSLSDARIAAVQYAVDYLHNRPELVWLGDEFRVEVTDESKAVLFTFIAIGVDSPAKTGRLRL